MSTVPRVSTAGIRLHQFVAGALPAMAYLIGWVPPVYVALGLSLLGLVSSRLAFVAWLLKDKKPQYGREDAGPSPGLLRLDEAVRVLLLGAGIALLQTGHPFGWLPILAAASVAILAGTTAFSFTLLIYVGLRVMLNRFSAGPEPAEGEEAGNPHCLVCRALRCAPYGRCRWCRLASIRWCCGLQTSMLLVLLMVIAFLLNATLEPLVTKLLVAMSIVGVMALSLAITRQTDDLIGSLNSLADAHRRIEKRCHFLKRLALTDSTPTAANATVAYTAETLGARRISVMLIEDGVLRIAACLGIADDVAARVAVPVPDRICGQVFARGAPMILNEASSDKTMEMLGLNAGPVLASYPLIAAPMETASRKVGVINVTDRPSGPFRDEDLAELQFVAEAAAISLSSQLDRRDLERANYATIRSLALTIEAKDACTSGHSQRVQVWATSTAQALGISGARLQTLTYAAELHDIGKLAIPDQILKAPRRLTPSEWAIVQEHPRRGVELVRHMTFLRPASTAILYHHERLDGTGYPEGLVGDQIPLEARILAVIDAYDAMTSARPYRPPLTHDEAAAELRRCSGSQFDPECVKAFLRVVGDTATAPVAVAAGADGPS